MKGESFKTTEELGVSRVMDIMNTKSSQNFRWSIRLTGNGWIYIGIASKLERMNDYIENYDRNSILFCPLNRKIYKGSSRTNKLSDTITCTAKNGDEIHFRFQPKLKKFSISLVSYVQLFSVDNYNTF